MLRLRRVANTRAVDWFRILADLQHLGLSNVCVSKALGVPPRTLGSWKNDGSEPRYSDGDALIEFWAKTTGRDRADSPRMLLPMGPGSVRTSQR